MNTAGLGHAVRHRLKAAILCLLLVGGMLSVLTAEALAHAALIKASPADGSVVAASPKTFSLTFNEPTSPLVLKLVRPDGSSTVLDRFVLRDTTLDIEGPASLGRGTYVLSWRVISEDGHPVAGSAVFSIGTPDASVPRQASDETDRAVRVAFWLAKIGLYLGLFVGIGGAFFAHWVGGRPPAVTPWTMAAGILTAGLSVGLQGLDALGEPLSGLMQGAVWKVGLTTTYGATALIAVLALAAGLSSLANTGSASRILSLAALLAAGSALAASGHASAAHPQWLTRPAVFIHAVGIAFWAGALLPLSAVLNQRTPEATTVLHRFSRLIPLAVAPLAAAGIVLACIQVQSLDALTTTAYGRILIIKLALLTILFSLAVVNRVRLTESAQSGEARANGQLRRSIGVELVLVLAIFAVAAAWRFTPPPRALAEAAAAPVSIHIHTAKAMADLTITPGRAGPATASIAILSGDFGALPAKEVTLVMANRAAGVEQIRRPAVRLPDGSWHVDGLNLPLPGRWSARIDILVSDFELVKLEDTVDIRP